MQPNEELQDFCRKYQAIAKPSNQVWRRARPVCMPPDTLVNNDYEQLFDYTEEPMVEITMPADRLRTLVEVSKLKEHYHNKSYYIGSEYQVMWQEMERECLLRNQYPAVKEAYERYQMMLKLVANC